MNDEITITLRVLFLHEANGYVAQCLEHDIAAQGKTLPEAIQAFERTIVGQFVLDTKAGKRPLEGIPAAPACYFEKFERAVKLATPSNLPEGIPPAFMLGSLQQDLRVI